MWKLKHGNEPKILGISHHKTRITYLKSAMKRLGYKIGDLRRAEHLHLEWANRGFKSIIEYCKTAEFFQDFPFSKSFTFIALNQVFPNSKFILPVWDSCVALKYEI